MTSNISSNVMEVCLYDFIDSLKTPDNKNNNTIQAYFHDVERFIEYANNHSIYSFNDISSDFMSSYKDYLCNCCALSSSTVSRALSSMRVFFRFLISNSIIDINPMRDVHNDPLSKRTINIMTHKEIDLFLSAPDINDSKGLRDRVMLEVMYATGLKATELISLDLNDINITLSTITCRKGDCIRRIKLYPTAILLLKKYISQARKIFVSREDEQALFVNINGERITRQGFWKIVKLYATKADIKKDITPHMLRDSFATHLIENGAEISEVQSILGHSDKTSTQKYVDNIRNNLLTTCLKHHPRA